MFVKEFIRDYNSASVTASDKRSTVELTSICTPASPDILTGAVSFSASCHMYLVSIYDRSMIKASIVNHPFKEIKSVLYS
jgi:hypothetical protein